MINFPSIVAPAEKEREGAIFVHQAVNIFSYCTSRSRLDSTPSLWHSLWNKYAHMSGLAYEGVARIFKFRTKNGHVSYCTGHWAGETMYWGRDMRNPQRSQFDWHEVKKDRPSVWPHRLYTCNLNITCILKWLTSRNLYCTSIISLETASSIITFSHLNI